MRVSRFILLTLAALNFLLPSSPLLAQEAPQERLVFAYKSGELFDTIQEVVLDQTDTQTLLVGLPGMNLWSPRVSPDTTRLAFLDKDGGFIWVSNMDGTAPLNLGNPVRAMSLEWSTDGTLIYFWADNFVFYSIPAAGGEATPLFAGLPFWSWFNDGGFQVWGQADEVTGLVTDRIQLGYSPAGQFGKVDLYELAVTTEVPQPALLFGGLGDNYTPNRGADGRIVFQADDDRAGSHRCWFLQDPATALPLTDLFSGSPVWSPSQAHIVFPLTTASTFGQTAYTGIIFSRRMVDGAITPQFTTGVGATPDFYSPAPPVAE